MRLWKVVILVDIALAIGVGGGYLWWGRDVARLSRELSLARQSVVAVRPGADRVYTGKGVVRTIVTDANAIFITHEDIPGLMRGMTMGFRAGDRKLLNGLAPGDVVQFTLKDEGNQLMLVAIKKEKAP